MPPRSSRPSSRKRGKSNDDKGIEEKIEQEIITTQQEKEEVPKAFDDLVFIEQCLGQYRSISPIEFESFLGEQLHLRRYKTDLRESILLDFYTYSIEFAVKASFSAEKTSALLLLMRKVKKHVVQLGDNDGIESVLLVLKVELLEYCSNREATVEVRPPEPTSEELAEQNKNRRKTPKGRKKVDETQVEEPSIEYETVILPPVLTAEDAKDISKFALHTLVQHWELYRYVFNQHQARNLSKYVEFLEQPMAPLPLATAIDDTEWNQRKAQERMEREQEEKRKQEEVERRRRTEEEEERIRLQKLEEERNAPKLSREDLHEIAEYLKFHIAQDVQEKKSEMVEKITELQGKLMKLENTRKGSAKKK